MPAQAGIRFVRPDPRLRGGDTSILLTPVFGGLAGEGFCGLTARAGFAAGDAFAARFLHGMNGIDAALIVLAHAGGGEEIPHTGARAVHNAGFHVPRVITLGRFFPQPRMGGGGEEENNRDKNYFLHYLNFLRC